MIPGTELAQLLTCKRLLIFDFDGTIADSSALHEQAFREVLEPLGLHVDYSRLAGRTTSDAVRHCFELNLRADYDTDLLDSLSSRKQVRGRELIATQLTAFPAAMALLQRVRISHRLALVTSGSRRSIELALSRLGLLGWFDPLLAAEDLERSKPAPHGFLDALQRTGIAAGDALVFEDSEAGFEAARRAGIDFIDATRLEQLMIRDAGDGN